MPKQTVEFGVSIRQYVKIALTGITGRVRELSIDENGVREAYVRYVDANKVVRDEWFREDGLEAFGE